jgi:hypothetical protein
MPGILATILEFLNFTRQNVPLSRILQRRVNTFFTIR